MRVLLVATSYRPNVGGLQQVVAELAAGLRAQGHAVAVITQRHPRTLPAAEILDDVPITRWFFLYPRWRDVQRGRLDLFLAGLFFFPYTLAQLFWRLIRARPQIVNLHFVGAPALFVLMARQRLPFRLIVSVHGDDVNGLPRQSTFDRWLFCATLRAADAVTAPSRHLLGQAQAIEPAIAPKAVVIPNGMNASNLFGVASPTHIVAVGRLVPAKGFDLLIRAMTYCDASIRLTLVGDGPERRALETLVRDLGLPDRVTFCGERSHADVLRLMATALLVAIPSRQDSFGLVALEALAVGRPVVATHVGGLPEVLQGTEAILVEPDNPTALAEAIRSLIARLVREPNFGARNREFATRFSTARMTDQYVQAYRDSR